MTYKRIFAFIVLAAISSSQVDAQSLQERLVPPQKVELPPLSTSDQPAPRKGTKIDQSAALRWILPSSAFVQKPLSLPVERQMLTRQRPAVDSPPLASYNIPAIPTPMVLVTVNGSYVASENPQLAPPLGTLPRLGEPIRKVTDDPTADSAHASITVILGLPAINPAPLLRIMLPDPFGPFRSTTYAEPPSDQDGFEASRLRAAPQALPVAPVDKKP